MSRNENHFPQKFGVYNPRPLRYSTCKITARGVSRDTRSFPEIILQGFSPPEAMRKNKETHTHTSHAQSNSKAASGVDHDATQEHRQVTQHRRGTHHRRRHLRSIKREETLGVVVKRRLGGKGTQAPVPAPVAQVVQPGPVHRVCHAPL